MKRIEMIGSPLSHVRTPGLLNGMLAESEGNLRVTLREVELSELPGFVKAAKRDADVVGLVVTMPLKTAICDFLARKTALVELIGACNCVRIEGADWIGANFDGFGFSRALQEAGVGVRGKRVLLLGCGGAGKAIAARIASERAAELVIDDPEPGKASAFVARLRARAVKSGPASRDDRFDIVVNASPLGMQAEDPSPVAPDVIDRCDVAVDIVIAPAESRFSRRARQRGKILIDGAAMVQGQVAFLKAFLLSEASSEGEAAGLAAGKAKVP